MRGVAGEGEEEQAGGGVPDAKDIVIRGRKDFRAVGCPSAGRDVTVAESENALTRSSIPDAEGVVFGGGGNFGAVVREDAGPDGIGVAL